MPRRNHTQPHIRYRTTHLAHTTPKRAFQDKQSAERAAKDLAKYYLGTTFHVYRSLTDGLWYLSSKKSSQ